MADIKECTKSEKLDKILEFFRKNKEEGYTSLDNGIDELLISIGLTDTEYYLQIRQDLEDKGVIRFVGTDKKLNITEKGETYSFVQEAKKVQLQFDFTHSILKEIDSSFYLGSNVDIKELLIYNVPDLPILEIGKRLKYLSEELKYVVDNPALIRSMYKMGTVKQYLDILPAVSFKITSEGHKYIEVIINEVYKNETVHVSNSKNVTIIQGSQNVKVDINDNEQMALLLPEIIKHFESIRKEDLELFKAAMQDIKVGEEIQPLAYERMLSVLANITTIASFVIPTGASV